MKNAFNTIAGKFISFIGGFITPSLLVAQNLVPNPGFEDTLSCQFTFPPHIECLDKWNESVLNVPVMNTPDLCYNGAVFFPPSSIPAYEGVKYIGVDCQPINAEFVQVELSQTMIAGKSYCVSFYASICDQTINPPATMGVYFSDGILTVNPYLNNIIPHVEGPVANDPAQWTKISGVYTASGGEDHIVLGAFQNSGQTGFSYMYMDMVEVYELPEVQVTTFSVCPGESLLLTSDVSADIIWSTGETSQSITISSEGIYWVEKTIGNCVVTDTFYVTAGTCATDTTVVEEPAITQTLFIPNAFTPDGDGVNDVWMVYGENLTDLDVMIYNRWGELIFISENLNVGWDGKNKKVPVKEDVYVYDIKFRKESGILSRKTGHLSLIR